MAAKTSGKTKLFISYSRKDRGRIERLYDALASEEDLRIFRDTDDILPTEEWKPRLEKLIRESDTIVFALSPASAASEVCAWELELAASLNKRIIPIVVENVDGAVPEAVSKLNYIFLTEADDFGRRLTKIQDAISLDIDWVREHTRLGELADRWEKAVRLGAQPLRGKELEAAERWLVEQPKNAPQPTELQRRYILESRKAATRRARITVMGSIAAMLIVGVLGAFAWVQRDVAQDREQVALANESRFIAGATEAALRNHDPLAAMLIAEQGLPTTLKSPDRPIDYRLVRAFNNAFDKLPQITAVDANTAFTGVTPLTVVRSPSGRFIAKGDKTNGRIQIIDVNEPGGAIIFDKLLHTSWQELDFINEETDVLLRQSDNRFRSFNIETGDELDSFSLPYHEIVSIHPLSDGKALAIIEEGYLHLFEVTGAVLREDITSPKDFLMIEQLSTISENLIAITAASMGLEGSISSNIFVIDPVSGSFVFESSACQSDLTMNASRSDSFLVFYCGLEAAHFVRFKNGAIEDQFVFEDTSRSLYGGLIQFSQSENTMFLGDTSKETDGLIFKLRDPASSIRLSSNPGLIVSAAFFGEDRFLATMKQDRQIYIWDTSNGGLIYQFKLEADFLFQSDLAAGGTRLVSASAGGPILSLDFLETVRERHFEVTNSYTTYSKSGILVSDILNGTLIGDISSGDTWTIPGSLIDITDRTDAIVLREAKVAVFPDATSGDLIVTSLSQQSDLVPLVVQLPDGEVSESITVLDGSTMLIMSKDGVFFEAKVDGEKIDFSRISELISVEENWTDSTYMIYTMESNGIVLISDHTSNKIIAWKRATRSVESYALEIGDERIQRVDLNSEGRFVASTPDGTICWGETSSMDTPKCAHQAEFDPEEVNDIKLCGTGLCVATNSSLKILSWGTGTVIDSIKTDGNFEIFPVLSGKNIIVSRTVGSNYVPYIDIFQLEPLQVTQRIATERLVGYYEESGTLITSVFPFGFTFGSKNAEMIATRRLEFDLDPKIDYARSLLSEYSFLTEADKCNFNLSNDTCDSSSVSTSSGN